MCGKCVNNVYAVKLIKTKTANCRIDINIEIEVDFWFIGDELKCQL